MADLTPAAQAVLDAYANRVKSDLHGRFVEPAIAAALRAAADQVVPDEPDYMRYAIPDAGWWDKHDLIRDQLLAIATELETIDG